MLSFRVYGHVLFCVLCSSWNTVSMVIVLSCLDGMLNTFEVVYVCFLLTLYSRLYPLIFEVQVIFVCVFVCSVAVNFFLSRNPCGLLVVFFVQEGFSFRCCRVLAQPSIKNHRKKAKMSSKKVKMQRSWVTLSQVCKACLAQNRLCNSSVGLRQSKNRANKWSHNCVQPSKHVIPPCDFELLQRMRPCACTVHRGIAELISIKFSRSVGTPCSSDHSSSR